MLNFKKRDTIHKVKSSSDVHLNAAVAVLVMRVNFRHLPPILKPNVSLFITFKIIMISLIRSAALCSANQCAIFHLKILQCMANGVF